MFISKKILFTLIVLVIGVLLGWLLGSADFRPRNVSSTNSIRIDSPEYRFINPLLFSDSPKSSALKYNRLVSDISKFIDTSREASDIASASIYFRDLNVGEWTGVDEDALYKPSSMLKVLEMMAALKAAEVDPSILMKKLTYEKKLSGGSYYEGNKAMKNGQYPLVHLVGTMIQSSDNDALVAVMSDPAVNSEFTRIYQLLHLPPEGLTDAPIDFMSPKSYATLFRTLYNSTFFSWQVSEQALELLSRTNFNDGLVAGVPAGTVVSHKFGENLDQLHDCGIIYYPKHPYLLCVMTKGSDLKNTSKVIAGISKIVYTHVDEWYKE